jgi:hypothetical protein
MGCGAKMLLLLDLQKLLFLFVGYGRASGVELMIGLTIGMMMIGSMRSEVSEDWWSVGEIENTMIAKMRRESYRS